MNFKKSASAIIVASLFAMNAFANNVPNSHTEQNKLAQDTGITELRNHGYIDVDLALLQEHPGFKVVLLTSAIDAENVGSINLSANGLQTEAQWLYVSSMAYDKPNVAGTISLKDSTLTIGEKITLQNARSSDVPSGNNYDTYWSESVKPAVYRVLLDNSVLKSNIVNATTITNGHIASRGNKTTIELTNNSRWEGDLYVDFDSRFQKPELLTTQNTVKLDQSTWVGNAQTVGGEKTNVALTNASAWNVTGESTVTNLTTDSTSSVVIGTKNSSDSANGVLQVKGVAEGLVSVNNNSKLHVDKAQNLSARLLSLDNVDVALQQTNNVNLIVDGSLNDGSVSADKLLNQANQSFTTGSDQKATIEVESGLIADGLSANVVGDKITSTHSNKNTNLVTTSELVAIQMMQWRAEADDMNQRMGELRDSTDANGLWVRTYGGKAEASKVDNEFVGFQFGYDHNVASGANQQFVGGAISYTKGDANYSTGTGDNDTFAFTGYSTWLLDNGSYVDFSAKYGKLNSDFDIKTGLGNLNGDYSTHGLAMGVEVGHRFPVANLFYVEPQVAFTASHIFGEDFGAGQGVTIEQDSINSYVARAGLAAGIKCPDNMGSVWMKASYLYDFDGETTTTAKNGAVTNQFAQDFGGGWYELGLGASMNFTKNLHGYADFEYASGAEIETPYKWNVGVRYTY